jgi:hypothetical protein
VASTRIVSASDPNSITQTAVALTANVSTQLLPANAARKSLAVLNRGSSDADLQVGGTATIGQGIFVAANGGGYVFDMGAVPNGAIQAIAPAATTLIVLEG